MDPIGGYTDLEVFLRPTFDHDKLKDVIKVMILEISIILLITITILPKKHTHRICVIVQ